MILADTSVWVDHLRAGDERLVQLLDRSEVLAHPWVVGELALGSIRQRRDVLQLLESLPRATVASAAELIGLVERHDLPGTGIGYVDAQLLASTALTRDARLWTRDRRLRAAAERLGVSFEP